MPRSCCCCYSTGNLVVRYLSSGHNYCYVQVLITKRANERRQRPILADVLVDLKDGELAASQWTFEAVVITKVVDCDDVHLVAEH